MMVTIPVLNGEALCAQVGGDEWFPDGENGPDNAAMYQRARRVCLRCEIQVQCASWAIENNERYGMWGGLSPRQRQDIRFRRGLDAGVA